MRKDGTGRPKVGGPVAARPSAELSGWMVRAASHGTAVLVLAAMFLVA